MTPRAMFAAACTTQVSHQNPVLLAHRRLKNTRVIEDLILRVSKRAGKASWAMIFKPNLAGIVDQYWSKMWAEHR
jgi:hypothetical protein